MNLLSPAAVWDNRFKTTETLIAVPCGRAGSATNTHYDQDILASATVWKKSALPVQCQDRFLGILILHCKIRDNRHIGGGW